MGSPPGFEEGAGTGFLLLFLFLPLPGSQITGPTPAPIMRSFYLQRKRRRKRRTTMRKRKRRRKRKRKSLCPPRSLLERRLPASRSGGPRPRVRRVSVDGTEGAQTRKTSPVLQGLGGLRDT